MPLTKRVKSAFLFPNGMLVACGIDDQQIPELNGPYSINKHKRIILESCDDCEFKGFDILPDGFVRLANDILYFRKKI